MKKILITSVFAVSLAACQMAQAITFTIVGSVGGAPSSGVTKWNFDSLITGPQGGPDVVTTGDAAAVMGPLANFYAEPFLSGGNGAGFGNANGLDTTVYLTSGITSFAPPSSVTLNFGAAQQYIGLLWGSIDLYNTLSFYNGISFLGSVTGVDVLAGANGDQGVNGTLYVNISTDAAFDSVVATSSQYAFEFDNVAFGEKPLGVPDGGSLMGVFGLALIGMAGIARRRS